MIKITLITIMTNLVQHWVCWARHWVWKELPPVDQGEGDGQEGPQASVVV